MKRAVLLKDMPKDYYRILGIDKKATTSEIKKAYRSLAKGIHPDVNQSVEADAAFHELNEAYMILSDPAQRKVYDEGREIKPPQLTEAQIRELIRRQQAQKFDEFRFHTRNIYPPTNYKANEKAASILNIIMMCFALSFIVDFYISRPIGQFEITAVNQKMAITGQLRDVDKYLLTTEHAILEITAYELQQLKAPAKVADIRTSIFYGNKSFRLSEDMHFIRNLRFELVVYLFVAIAFLAGSCGLLPSMSPERKFNAAIVSTFFSLVVLALLLIS